MDSPLTTRFAERPDADLLGRFFSEFLDESAFSDFRRVERLVASLRAQGLTVAGYPVIRPSDCARIIVSLEDIFEQGKPHFRTRDPAVTARFEDLIGGFSAFCHKVYPGEAMGVLLLHGRVRLFMGDAAGALELVSHHALRPYAVESGVETCARFVETFAQAHLQRGTLREVGISFVAFGAWMARHGARGMAAGAGVRMAPFVAFGPRETETGAMPVLIRRFSRRYLDAVKGRARPFWRGWARVRARLYRRLLGLCYGWLARSRSMPAPFSMRRNPAGTTLVTRGMGGIGDLLMMAPGIEALAARQRAPVDFAIPRKFHAVFAHNPHVRLLDVDGPVIDISTYRDWSNLSLCPAGRYESRKRPRVRKGRVELFARAMRVTRPMLDRQGWRINHHLSAEEVQFCDDFIAGQRLGGRKLVGIQPFSRDSYKDHSRIEEIVAAIARHHDVLVFHHVADGLPAGPGIRTTAGLPLGRSLALVSRLDAMVSVDSAFLHAAAAFDVPVVALFGPTDARTFTRHHRAVKILWKPQTFGCVPCWRNEDIPCAVTGLRSMSPCIAAITAEEVLGALDEMMA